MAGGEVCKGVFSRVNEPREIPQRPDLPAFRAKQCCFKLPVLAQYVADGSDPIKNDVHSVIGKYDPNLFDTVKIFLQRYAPDNPLSVDGWEISADLSGTPLGIYYPFDSENMMDAEDRYGYVGAYVEWQQVLEAHGEGTYRFHFEEKDTDGNITDSYHIFEFCLKEYMPYRADYTVRFEWYTKGIRGDVFLDDDTWDFTQVEKIDTVGAEGWKNQMRLPDSFFGDNSSGYEREYVKYSNGQQVWIKDEQVESYAFHSGMFPAKMHQYIKTEIIQADRILVTDYNSKNPNVLVDKAVNPSGGYEPSWNYNNLRAMVTVEFEQEFQNRRKRRC